MKIKKEKTFANGKVYSLELDDGLLIETTSTFLPFYTKDAIGRKQNFLDNGNLGSRKERWMIGVSVMSGCPVKCKFCATGKLKKWRNLSAEEIVKQVEFMVKIDGENPNDSKEFKINYTRMGEPFLNIENVKRAIDIIDSKYNNVHHYVSTVGIIGADYSWIKDNITLQVSVHSTDDNYRNWLIPYKKKISLEEMGKIRTNSKLKTTVNLTLVRKDDFDIKELVRMFDKDFFFIKISPVNINETSQSNNIGSGIIEANNLI